MIMKFGRPVRSTESTASESMNTARSTSMIRREASTILYRADARPSCRYSQTIRATEPTTVKTSSVCDHGCSKRI